VPQLPQFCSAAPLHTWPVHAFCQLQSSPQRWVPLAPQLRVLPGEHAPWSEQLDQPDQRPVVPSQVRVCSPQFPQLRTPSPRQTCPVQGEFQRQLALQVCVPPAPQLRVSVGSHTPWPVHGDQFDQRPLVLSQSRV
jgi:hypothetical protein